jgi:hypothetical protein
MNAMISAAAREPFKNALAKVQAMFIKNEGKTGVLAAATHSQKGGQRMRTLRAFLFTAANGQCVCCRQFTALDVNAASANAATAGILIGSALVGISESRGGYLPGNVALFCRMCVNLRNNPITGMPLWIWTADIVDAESVPLNWPSLPKTKGAQVYKESIVDAQQWRRECLRRMTARGISPLPN